MKTIDAIRLREKKIDVLYKEIKAFQSKCKHKKATFKYGSNTGNWDKSQDIYWKDYNCPDCDKIWTEDQ